MKRAGTLSLGVGETTPTSWAASEGGRSALDRWDTGGDMWLGKPLAHLTSPLQPAR